MSHVPSLHSSQDDAISLEAGDEVSEILSQQPPRRSRPSLNSLPSQTARSGLALIRARSQGSSWSTATLPANSSLRAEGGSNAETLADMPRKLSLPARLDKDPATIETIETAIETFDKSEQAHYTVSAPTTHALTDFSKFIARQQEDLEQAEERRALARNTAAERAHYEDILNRLRRSSDEKNDSYWKRFVRLLRYGKAGPYPKPTDHELLSLTWHVLPPRPKVRAIVCDFGDGMFQRSEVSLSELEYYVDNKPKWATVRWIHAPLGLGLFHSSIEDIFLKSGTAQSGRPFVHSGRPGFPFLETDALNFRSKKEVQDIRDVFALLYEREDISKILDKSVFDGNENTILREDVTWRAGHLRTDLRYWDTVQSDIPWHLADTLSLGLQGPLSVIRKPDKETEDQILGQTDFFSNAHLVVNRFRLFHRKDGYVLSLSATKGVNYLDGDFNDHLSQPTELMHMNRQASVVAQVADEFSATGTKEWYRASVEWFVIYLFTEIIATPHNVRSGLAAPTMLDGYQSLIRQMKRNRFRPWERTETARLVHSQLACADELSSINLLLSAKCDVLKRLERDARVFEADERKDARRTPLTDSNNGNNVNNPAGQSSLDRIRWARTVLEEQHLDSQHLASELRQSMNTLFQLRSIEQNELAIAADIQNKAVIVFAAVTVVFLPLSFFTGYYGMNLQGIVDTDKGQKYFWRVCGSIGLTIVAVICLYAFRHRMQIKPKFDSR